MKNTGTWWRFENTWEHQKTRIPENTDKYWGILVDTWEYLRILRKYRWITKEHLEECDSRFKKFNMRFVICHTRCSIQNMWCHSTYPNSLRPVSACARTKKPCAARKNVGITFSICPFQSTRDKAENTSAGNSVIRFICSDVFFLQIKRNAYYSNL